jgi:hypothetical protein
VVTLGAGMLVVNLNCERAPKVTLYETHRDAGCRVLRQAISMLGMEAEIRSIPEAVPGIPSPWRDELQAILTAEGREFALPYLVGIDIPEIRAKQGDGAALAKILMQMYCLDPKEAFPLDLSPKLLKTLATVASHIRAYLPWGVTAQPIAWAKVNEARDAANVAAGAVTSPSDTETGGFTIISSPVPSPSSMSSSTSVPVAAALPSPSSSSRALPTPPLTPRTPLSPSLRTLEPTSPSIGSSGVSDSALKLRAQMERQALARENGSAGRSVMVEEELHPVWSIKELQPLLLYGSEASPSCRPVFELLCSLQIPYHLKTCAQGSVHRAGLVLEYGTQWKLPTLVDSNTRRVLIGGTAAVEYMLNTYTDGSK